MATIPPIPPLWKIRLEILGATILIYFTCLSFALGMTSIILKAADPASFFIGAEDWLFGVMAIITLFSIGFVGALNGKRLERDYAQLAVEALHGRQRRRLAATTTAPWKMRLSIAGGAVPIYLIVLNGIILGLPAVWRLLGAPPSSERELVQITAVAVVVVFACIWPLSLAGKALEEEYTKRAPEDWYPMEPEQPATAVTLLAVTPDHVKAD